MIYCFDIDGTICSLRKDSKYLKAEPFEDTRLKINRLYDSGNTILFMTARGSVSGKDWTNETRKQLQRWGFKYHKLIMNKKPHADIFIDDKAVNIADWQQSIVHKKVGLIAGAFDVIHPGYIATFKETREMCDYLIVALHKDPSFERPLKMRPVLTIEERKDILLSLAYVDEVRPYETEEDLYNLLKSIDIDIRFLGDDYRHKDYTGDNLNIPAHFCSRSHGWSATKFKNLLRGIKNENIL